MNSKEIHREIPLTPQWCHLSTLHYPRNPKAFLYYHQYISPFQNTVEDELDNFDYFHNPSSTDRHLQGQHLHDPVLFKMYNK